jgi:hypothetical protein
MKMVLYSMALLFLISACSKKDADTDPVTNGNGTDSVPQITAFAPAAGAADTLVTISGKNFTNDKSIIAVRFGTTAATDIVSASTTEIKVKVPKAALPGKVKLTVSVSGKDAISVNDFTIEPTTWKKLFGGSDDDYGNSIWRTSDGGYITAGSTYSSNNGDVAGVNKGYSDIWIVKTDADGNIVWQKNYGGSGTDVANAITGTVDGGVLVAGYTRSSNTGDVGLNQGAEDMWILKLDANGNLLWQKTFGGTGSESAEAVTSSTDGGFIVAGTVTIYNISNPADNHTDVRLLKLDANGNMLWQKTYGGSNNEVANGLTASGDGGFVVSGATTSNNTGNVGSNHGSNDMWIVKIDVSGNLVWQKTLGGSGDDIAYGIVPSTDGGFVVAGSTQSDNNGDVGANHGDFDLWVVKLNATGNLVWQKTVGGSRYDGAYSIATSPDGGFVFVGETNSNNSGDVGTNHGGFLDLWVVKLSANGTLAGQLLMGGNDYDSGTGIIPTPGAGYIVAGGTSSNNNGDVGANHGKSDMWLVKIKEL